MRRPRKARRGGYKMTHDRFSFAPFALALSATRAASVKASLTPRFIFAEHSRYRSACPPPTEPSCVSFPRFVFNWLG